LDYIKNIIKSRLLPVSLVFVVLFSILINRLFQLQIVEGPTIAEETILRDTRNREIKSTRGNIYDRNGKILASNVLSYSVMLEDSSAITSNDQRNAIILHLINIIEKNGGTLDNEFYIIQNDNDEFEFTITGSALTRFKVNSYAYVLENKVLTEKQEASTAKEVYDFLKNGTGDNYTRMFGISDDYSVEDALKIMSVRYALFCNYPKHLQITVASNVNEETVAEVLEERANLPGVEISKQTQRYYHDSVYFAHILGYTGLINADELEAYDDGSNYYNYTDVIGKSGLEKEFESYLSGKKGSEIVAVNSANKVIDVIDRIDPVAGNDLYLTIDSDLQRDSYHIMEKEIASILIDKIRPNMDYGTKGESSSNILTPIYEVYFALINNNIIDIKDFNDSDATALEKKVNNKYKDLLSDVFNELDDLLKEGNNITNDKAGDMEEYLDYFYKTLDSQGLFINELPKDDPIYKDYHNDKISLSKFIYHGLANNWIDISKLEVGDKYHSVGELYDKLIKYMKDILKTDDTFNKKVYKSLVFTYKLSGTEICLLLFDQGVLEYNENDINRLNNGSLSSYQFMLNKLKSLEITPAMLALEPYSGSIVVTDVNNGNVLAMVTYPSYDNNKMANKVDSQYFNMLRNDKTAPFINRPVQQILAPGSIYKMISAVTALEEGVVTPYEKIRDLGVFDKILPAAKCHVYPRSHGSVNIVDAIKVSCNYFFYEAAYRLSIDSSGQYNEQLGLNKIANYASQFGFDGPSGVELPEYNPIISNKDPIRSAIGQGTNGYTAAQLSKYVSTIATKGVSYDLTLLNKIVDKDGKVMINTTPEPTKVLSDIKPSTWSSIQEGMYSVVNVSGGSVYNSGLYKDLGFTVAGKTGTSQIRLTVPNNALFLSYAPYENPEISIITIIPNGHTSGNAAELTRDIYNLYYNPEKRIELIESDVTLPENNINAFSD
ncbi:MAG: peptidase, partial [Clostridiales bacterium]|nr:peptidase [Clostridiales bacterium]